MKLIFSNTDSLLSKYIQWRTKSKWSHVDILYDDNICVSTLPITGSKMIPVKDALKGLTYFEVLEVPTNPELDKKILSEELNKPYDYMGVLGINFERNWQDSSSWFCSELAAFVLQQSGIRLPEEIGTITPGFLYEVCRRYSIE